MEKISKQVGYILTASDLDELELKPRKILMLRYGLEDGMTHTLEETGREFGVTRERIRQIEAKAFEQLRIIAKSKYTNL